MAGITGEDQRPARGGPFRLPAGAWTDGTSMALCLGDDVGTTAAIAGQLAGTRWGGVCRTGTVVGCVLATTGHGRASIEQRLRELRPAPARPRDAVRRTTPLST